MLQNLVEQKKKLEEEIEKLTKAFNTLSGEVQSISEKGKAKENPVNKFKESLSERAKALKDNADTLKTEFKTELISRSSMKANQIILRNELKKLEKRVAELEAKIKNI